MMKNISFRKLSLLGGVAMASLITSCTGNFDEWNVNPDEVTEEVMQYDDLKTGAYFVQMQKNVFPIEQLTAKPEIGASVYQTMQNLTGDSFAGYTGPIGQWLSGRNFTTYDMTVDWRNMAFERGFVGVMPSWKTIVDVAKEFSPATCALATIVKVEAMHRITDMYGPLPYLNFGEKLSQNNYDSQEEIYDSFFTELGGAIDELTRFNSQTPSATVLAKYDYIYSGKTESWIKFANTLRLRLAMRIVYANPTKAQEEAEKSVNHPIGVMTTTADAARLNKTGDLNYRHPLAVCLIEFDDVRMGATMDSYLNGYKDPRINTYFQPATSNKFAGVRNGIKIDSKDTYAKGPFSLLNISYSDVIVWMNPAESYFLRAEGALRGWNMGGEAQTLYETGVRTSFESCGVSGSDTYLANATDTPAKYVDPIGSNSVDARGNITIQWKNNDSFEKNLERIITQKWIAIYPDGQEAWSEFRRTGYPKVFPNVVNYSGGTIDTEKQVRRIPFSAKEYSTNASGIATGISHLKGDDNGGTKLWWDKK